MVAALARFVVTALLIPTVAFAAETDELLLVLFRTPVVTGLLHQPIDQVQSIADRVKRTALNGYSHTVGTLTADAYQSYDGIGLSLQLASTTTLSTRATGDGVVEGGPGKSHPEIAFQFDGVVTTNALTTKRILFRENGIAVYPAATGAAGTVTGFGNQRTQAQGILPGRRFETADYYTSDGRIVRQTYRIDPNSSAALPTPGGAIFPRLRAKVAPPKIEQEFVSQKTADQTAETVAKKLSESFDQSVWNQLLPYHYKYLKYVHGPFIERGLLDGHLGFSSDANWLAIRGVRGAQIPVVDLARIHGIREIPSSAVAIARLHENFLNRLASMRFGGTTISDVEANDLLGRSTVDEDSFEGLLGNPRLELLYTFDDAAPVEARFREDRIDLHFRYSQLETLGKAFQNVVIDRSLAIVRDRSGVALKSLPVESVRYANGTRLPEDVATHIASRVNQGLPKTANSLSEKILMPEKLRLRIGDVRAADGQLTITLERAPQ